jgi:hypothetical protein
VDCLVVVVVEPKEIDQSEADIACGGRVGQTGASEPKNQLFMYMYISTLRVCVCMYVCMYVLVSLI